MQNTMAQQLLHSIASASILPALSENKEELGCFIGLVSPGSMLCLMAVKVSRSYFSLENTSSYSQSNLVTA